MDDSLLKTKLNAPPIRELRVHRPHLLEKLNVGLTKRLTLVSAPAGYGKSTLVRSWLVSQPATAWLALDQGDNEPRVFWQYLIAAIQTVEQGLGSDVQRFLRSQKFEEPQPVLVNILNELDEKSIELTLVLDDYHFIVSKDIHDSLNYFLEHKPPTVHLVLLTRVDPPFPLGRLRANDDLSEIRTADLQFRTDECNDFMSRVMNLDLDQDQIGVLNARTEGWIAGLQMAGLSIKGLVKPEQVAGFINDFTGSHRHIFDYLTDEVLAHQTQETRDFLMRTSILDRFNAPLCKAVTGNENSQAILEHLERSSLFLFPLDEDRHWYRYHHLFATLLQRRLKHRPDLMPASLNQLAADWFEAHGMVDLAIQHLQDANNPDDMARLIRQYGAEALQPGQLGRLQRWLDNLPADTVQNDVLLAGLQAWIYYFEQQTDQVFIWVGHIQRAVEQSPEQTNQSPIESWGTILGLQSWVACQRGDYRQGVQLAQEALDRLPSSDHTWRGKIYILLAEALAGEGRTAEAISAYELSLQYNQEAGNWIATSAILAAIWMTKVLRGYLHEGKQQLDQVILTLMKLGQAFNASILRMARLAILYEQNELDQVGTELADLWKYIKFDSTVAIARYYYLTAMYYAALGEHELAIRSLRSLEEAAVSWSTPDERARAIGGAMRIYLRLGERNKTDVWLRSVEFDPKNLTLLRNDEYLAIADVLRFSDSYQDRQDGLELVDALLEYCDELQIYSIKIEVYCLKALLIAVLDNTTAALTQLEPALSAGESQSYVRTFVDFGQPMEKLLEQAISHQIHNEYATFLLTQFTQTSGQQVNDKPWPGLNEPLSERELEVLALLASHLSGPEIADRLNISPNTIKTHIRNIYSKLGVNSRDQAVIKTQELNLL